jgi:1,4-dihydroxy-6-naphthoate synthase
MPLIRLAFSPCPNDTFIFDALVNGRIDLEGLSFDVQLADIDVLNQLAATQAVDVCKVSFHAYALKLQADWHLLDAGAALGRGVGPLLVQHKDAKPDSWRSGPIAIPGLETTAHFLLRHYAHDCISVRSMLFSEIMPAVAKGEVAAGVIIHESRFVYESYGLALIRDLGTHWEETTGLPIPLGGIVALRRLGPELLVKLNRVVARSVNYAFEHPEASRPYIRLHAQELDEVVTQAHIDLYVNSYTRNLGAEGHLAVQRLLEEAGAQG